MRISGLTVRILAAGIVVVAFLVVVFMLVITSIRSVQSQTAREQRAEATAEAAARVQRLILDVEIGTGFVITGDERFLVPWRNAQRKLPAATAALLAADPGQGGREIVAAARDYATTWSLPLIRLAQRDPAAAKLRLATAGRRRSIEALAALIDPYTSMRLGIATHEQAEVRSTEHRAIVVGVAGVVVTALLFLGIVGYFLRAAVAPLRRIAEATDRVKGGELGVVVPERGAGEVGQLSTAFNAMSRSLERQQHEVAAKNEALERLANVLRAVLDSTVDGILLSDREGEIQVVNRPLVEMTRELGMVFEGTLVEQAFSAAERTSDPEGYRMAFARLAGDQDGPGSFEFEVTSSGRVFQLFASPVHDDQHEFVGRIWTLREITQQRALDRLKDDFVATVSHELRTPLTSMMGFLEMIREGEAGPLTDEQERFLAIVYRSSERLQRLVGDLLFVQRLDANGLQLHFGEVRLDEVVRDVAEATAALARAREIDLRLELEPLPPVSADRERLAQLVGNLLSNALKFTRTGGRVVARTFTDAGRAVLEIEDTGIGVPATEQDRLFERFFRASTATEQAIPGTGLGLVISKAIVEAHGGTIGVQSELGTGTTFRVELPLEPVLLD